MKKVLVISLLAGLSFTGALYCIDQNVIGGDLRKLIQMIQNPSQLDLSRDKERIAKRLVSSDFQSLEKDMKNPKKTTNLMVPFGVTYIGPISFIAANPNLNNAQKEILILTIAQTVQPQYTDSVIIKYFFEDPFAARVHFAAAKRDWLAKFASKNYPRIPSRLAIKYLEHLEQKYSVQPTPKLMMEAWNAYKSQNQ